MYDRGNFPRSGRNWKQKASKSWASAQFATSFAACNHSRSPSCFRAIACLVSSHFSSLCHELGRIGIFFHFHIAKLCDARPGKHGAAKLGASGRWRASSVALWPATASNRRATSTICIMYARAGARIVPIHSIATKVWWLGQAQRRCVSTCLDHLSITCRRRANRSDRA